MMTFSYRTKQHIHVQLDQLNPLGKGGEGSVYSVINTPNYPNHCAKIFHPNRLTADLERKINFMVDNQPSTLISTNYRIAWPIASLYHNKKFYGFIMPKAFDKSIGLERVTQPQISLKGIDTQWIKYQRNDKQGMINCFKVCVNIAFIVNLIHQMKKYTFVDLKPQNILVNLNGFVSITDIDSMQVYDPQKNLYYKSVVSTAEYSPPEYQSYLKKGGNITQEWDNFSMAVIFYQLMTGVHPFAATFGGKFSNSTTIDDHISQSLFVFGDNRQTITKLPPLHTYYQQIPLNIQQLFLRAFDKPVSQRPTAEEWGQNLFELVSKDSHLIASNTAVAALALPVKSALKPAAQSTTGHVQMFQLTKASTHSQGSQSTKAPHKSYAWVGWLIVLVCIIVVIAVANA
ncbi:MAG TPA: hypothetical protein DEF47_12775 [Herpetosiphon sp.]|uniref:Serine/threonine protein kinase n=1 Tax=Herpetosiphon aurantiacus (strain ATCC 23779 / DSM 785 / 114-95) TaxID=316274 RepID=A9AV57_HERA2|nr:protein kinase [Herpetosiphon sp.]ABX03135.1 serine/threonine protein kinase [Herpetosiphon aurantiacus DSM 785]HBW50764.1 hypothetical protein [Herpetosiphon sp.]